MTTLRAKVLGTPGYDASLRLEDFELAAMREIVHKQYCRAVCSTGIESCGDHAKIFAKARRLLEPFQAGLITVLPFLQTLRAEFGNFTLSKVILPDGTQEDREEIYWRIVRPNHPEDVGKLHRDSDFHKQYGIEQGKQTVKCWIPLWCERCCGLIICTNDHNAMVDEPGTIALFNSDVQHIGAVNTGTTARVSVEMTLVLDD